MLACFLHRGKAVSLRYSRFSSCCSLRSATVNDVNWDGAFPPERTAYVAIHDEDNSFNSAAHLIAIRCAFLAAFAVRLTADALFRRVWARNLRNSGTTRDIVVLTSASTTEHQRALLTSDPARIIVKTVRDVVDMVGSEVAASPLLPECEQQYVCSVAIRLCTDLSFGLQLQEAGSVGS